MNKLKELFQQMSELTKKQCEKDCSKFEGHIGSCCSWEYCEYAIEIAKKDYGVELISTEHPTLKLMGEKGCTAEPYFKPLCTLHICDKSLFDLKFSNEYFKLRDQINDESFKNRSSCEEDNLC